MASGFLSYSGPFNQEFRNLLLDNWKNELKIRSIPYSANLNLIEMLTDQTTVCDLYNMSYKYVHNTHLVAINTNITYTIIRICMNVLSVDWRVEFTRSTQ